MQVCAFPWLHAASRLLFCLLLVQPFARERATGAPQRSGDNRKPAAKPASAEREPSKGAAETPLLALICDQAGPPKADEEGRTRRPMTVPQSVGFREVGPAISGGRVAAVAGLPGNNETYDVGAAIGGIFRTSDGRITWKALFQHENVASIGALAVDPLNLEVVWVESGEANIRNRVSFGGGVYRSTDGRAHGKCMGVEGSLQYKRRSASSIASGRMMGRRRRFPVEIQSYDV
jgi:hypothetical protein